MAPAALDLRPDLPFKYVGGDPSVDLVNTVDWTAAGLVHDRLADYERLTRWAEGAGLLPPETGERLRRYARSRPREGQAAHDAARWLRWVLQRLFTSIAAGERSAGALDDFNELLGDCLRRLEVGDAGGTLAWTWRGMGENLESVLWPVIWFAAQLLTSDEVGELRVCGGPDCGWMYVDRSRNHLRRWCEMETCGTREKARRRAARARRATTAARRQAS